MTFAWRYGSRTEAFEITRRAHRDRHPRCIHGRHCCLVCLLSDHFRFGTSRTVIRAQREHIKLPFSQTYRCLIPALLWVAGDQGKIKWLSGFFRLSSLSEFKARDMANLARQ